MGGLSIWHFLIVLAVVLLIWGPGRISPLMGELAKGVKSFKKGLSDDSANQASNTPNAATGGTPGVTAQNPSDARQYSSTNPTGTNNTGS
ncbi:MAG: twin-arginine translocase TatA/TatE family subunit [Candidatus Symbiobacter sp.]|nr:twin-arginine translocase TatA/TatE family subunit [Candidatus Symbiobacter sp.]